MAENDKPAEVVNPNKDIIIEDMVLTVIHCWMQKTAREISTKQLRKDFLSRIFGPQPRNFRQLVISSWKEEEVELEAS